MPNPVLEASAFAASEMEGRWYQVACVSDSYYQRKAQDCTIDVEEGGSGGGSGKEDGGSSGAGDRGAPLLRMQRQELLGGIVFQGNVLETASLAYQTPGADSPACMTVDELSGRERKGVPFCVLEAGHDVVSPPPSSSQDAAGSPDDSSDSHVARRQRRVQRNKELQGSGLVSQATALGAGKTRRRYAYVVVGDGAARQECQVWARSPKGLPSTTMDAIVSSLESRGYEVDSLAHTTHTKHTGGEQVNANAATSS